MEKRWRTSQLRCAKIRKSQSRQLFSIKRRKEGEKKREYEWERGVRKEKERRRDTFLSEASKKFCFVLNKEDKWNFSVQFSHSGESDSATPWTSTPGLPVHHQLPELAQIYVHWAGDIIQPSYPLTAPSPLALNLSQHQGLFKWVSPLHQLAKVLEFQLQHQSFLLIFRVDFL